MRLFKDKNGDTPLYPMDGSRTIVERHPSLWAQIGLMVFYLIATIQCQSIMPASMHQDTITNAVFYTVQVKMGVPEQVLTLVVDFQDDHIRTFKPMRTYSGTFSDAFGGSEVLMLPEGWYRLPTGSIPATSNLPRLCPSCDGSIGMRRDSLVWKLWPQISFSMGSMTLGETNEIFNPPESCAHFELECLAESSVLGPCPVRAIANGKQYLVVFDGGPKTKLPQQLYDEYVRSYNIYDSTTWTPLKIHFLTTNQTFATVTDDGVSDEDTLSGSCAPYPHLFVDTESYMLESSNGLRYINLESWDNDGVISLGVGAWSDTMVHIDTIRERMLLKPYIHKRHISGERLLLFCLALLLFVRWKLTDSHLKASNNPECKKHNLLTMLYMILSVPLMLYSYLSQPTRSILRDYQTADAYVFGTLMGALVTFIACWLFYLNIRTVDDTFRLNLVKDITLEHALLTSMWLLMLERRDDTMATGITFAINVMSIYNLGFFGILIIAYYLQASVSPARPRAIFTFYCMYVFPVLCVAQSLFAYYYFGKPFFRRFIFYLDADVSSQATIIVFCIVAQGAFYVASLYGKKAILEVMWADLKAVKKAETKPISYAYTGIHNMKQ